ncbi:hypothetical protein PUN28_011607 [Cardiocondyla obscurior]|uniref:Uncharacterized protein n=1 Tax=Cardiocondyla obscurior TaxID=286306 RepID=A0AAW2FJW4_9HYME
MAFQPVTPVREAYKDRKVSGRYRLLSAPLGAVCLVDANVQRDQQTTIFGKRHPRHWKVAAAADQTAPVLHLRVADTWHPTFSENAANILPAIVAWRTLTFVPRNKVLVGCFFNLVYSAYSSMKRSIEDYFILANE